MTDLKSFNDIILKVDNNSTYIEGSLTSELYKGLKEVLGYIPEDAQWMKPQSNDPAKAWMKNWTGLITNICYNKAHCRCFIKKDGTHFSSGLVRHAINYLKSNNVSVKFVDVREKVEKNYELEMSSEFEVRPYQTDAIEKAIKAERGIIKAATGSGKTGIIAGVIAGLDVSPSIFYVTSKDLLNQAHDEMERFLRHNGSKIKVGIVGGGNKDIQNVTVMTIQTAVRALGAKYKKFDDEDIEKDNTKIEDITNDIKDLVMSAKFFAIDECQHVSQESCQIVADASKSARYRFGASVSANSLINIYNGENFNQIQIEDLYNKFDKNITKDGIYEIKNVDNLLSRGYNGNNFVWKPIKKIIRHKEERELFRIFFAGKHYIDLTEDHSVFVLKNNNLESIQSNELKIKDTIFMDNGNEWIEKNSNKKIIDYIDNKLKHNIRVSVDLSMVFAEQLGLNKQSFSQIKKRAKKIGYLGSLKLSQYLEYQNILPNPEWIYIEAARGQRVSWDICWEDMAYLAGFYLGDGWMDGSRISFAVETSRLNNFISRIKSIIKIKANIQVKKSHGDSFEVKVSCWPLAQMFKNIFKEKKCWEKFIPTFMLMWPEKHRRELLLGLIHSDGSQKLTENDIERNRTKETYTSTSKCLIDDVMCLLRSLNIQYTLSVRKPSDGGIVRGRKIKAKRTSYQLIWTGNARNGINGGHFGNKKTTNLYMGIEKQILKIEKVKSTEYVYDLEMEGHPSFVANGLLVHNSATPTRDLNDDILIEACFGKTIVDISASYLIQIGELIRPEIFFVPIKNMRGLVKSNYASVYKQAIVENPVRNEIIANVAKEMEKNGRIILILCKHIAHGELLKELIPNSYFVHGSTSSKIRNEHLDKMRRREACITISSVIFDEGIDCRPLDALILGGSGKSSTRALQRVGRTLRKYPGKTSSVVIDFEDHCKYVLAHSKKRRKIYLTEPEFVVRDYNG